MLNFGGVFQNASKTVAPNKPTSRNLICQQLQRLCDFFVEEMQVPLDDADATVHRLYAPGSWLAEGMRREPIPYKLHLQLALWRKRIGTYDIYSGCSPSTKLRSKESVNMFFVVLGRGESQRSMFCFNLFDTHTIDIVVLSPKLPGQTGVNLTSEGSPVKNGGNPWSIGDAAIELGVG